MNTSIVYQSSRTNKPTWELKFSFAILATGIIFMFGILHVQSTELLSGIWTGNYTLHSGEQLETRYVIQIRQSDEGKSYAIKMLILDTEPEITYNLKKISLEKETLVFIKGNEESKAICRLEKNDQEEYHGTCQSTLDEDSSMLAQISMIPPKEESPREESIKE